MPRGFDRVGYGDCIPSKEEEIEFKRETERTERMIRLKNTPPWHLSKEEKHELAKHYGLAD